MPGIGWCCDCPSGECVTLYVRVTCCGVEDPVLEAGTEVTVEVREAATPVGSGALVATAIMNEAGSPAQATFCLPAGDYDLVVYPTNASVPVRGWGQGTATVTLTADPVIETVEVKPDRLIIEGCTVLGPCGQIMDSADVDLVFDSMVIASTTTGEDGSLDLDLTRPAFACGSPGAYQLVITPATEQSACVGPLTIDGLCDPCSPYGGLTRTDLPEGWTQIAPCGALDNVGDVRDLPIVLPLLSGCDCNCGPEAQPNEWTYTDCLGIATLTRVSTGRWEGEIIASCDEFGTSRICDAPPYANCYQQVSSGTIKIVLTCEELPGGMIRWRRDKVICGVVPKSLWTSECGECDDAAGEFLLLAGCETPSVLVCTSSCDRFPNDFDLVFPNSAWIDLLYGSDPPCPTICCEGYASPVFPSSSVVSPLLMMGTSEPPLPSPLTMAANYARSTVRHLAAGRPQATPELQAARLAVCEACDHLRPSDRRCGLVKGCGCGCPVDEKVQRLLDRCPVNRWPKPGPSPGTGSADPPTPAAPH